MSWTSFFDRIFVVNLPTRNDRLLATMNELNKFNIPFSLVEAISHDKGAEGLKITMLKLFNECINAGYKNILVFEDDVEFVSDKVNETMDLAVQQLPENYHILYLGCQPTHGYPRFYSDNLLPVTGAFATHACGYSLLAMKSLVALDMQAPIDNFIVRVLQPENKCYQTYPFLASQREGFSDIGKAEISWKPFLEVRHKQKIAEMKQKGRFNH